MFSFFSCFYYYFLCRGHAYGVWKDDGASRYDKQEKRREWLSDHFLFLWICFLLSSLLSFLLSSSLPSGFSWAERKKMVAESFLGVQNKPLYMANNTSAKTQTHTSNNNSNSSKNILSRTLFQRSGGAKISASSLQKCEVTEGLTDKHVTDQARKLFDSLSCNPVKPAINFKGRETDRYFLARPASMAICFLCFFSS